MDPSPLPFSTPEALAEAVRRAPAGDPALARQVAALYDLDPAFTQLNFGYYHPALAAVNRAEAAAVAAVNRRGSRYKVEETDQRTEEARRLVAAEAGVAPEEAALVRSSSEAINMVLQGWPLGPGDEVVASDADYAAVQETLEQRRRRDGIVVRRVTLPPRPETPLTAEAYTSLFSDRTRLVVVTDLIHLNGRRTPSLEVVRAARARGIPVFVDGAHSFGQLDTQALAQQADFFCASLHKWVGAPLGTGLLVVRPGVLGRLWPLYGDVTHDPQDIRRLERLGDRSDAVTVGLLEALAWHRALGWAWKGARVAALHSRWADVLASWDEVEFTSPGPGSRTALGAFRLRGIEPAVLVKRLWDEARIHTAVVPGPGSPAVRVVPGLATTEAQVDRFVEALEAIRKTLSA